MTKIDDRTLVPLAWLVVMLLSSLGTVVAGTFWVASVNNRLSRIEDRLGIEKYSKSSFLIDDAFAGPDRTSVNPASSR